jgi:CRISP-associated protein Cas1
MILLMDTNDLAVKVRNGCFEICKDQTTKLISTSKIEGIIVSAKINIHTSAMILAFQNDIPIYYLDRFGGVVGISRKANFNNASIIRRNQVLFLDHVNATKWVKTIFDLKQNGQSLNMKYFIEKRPSLASQFNGHIASCELTTEKIKNLKNTIVNEVRPSILGLEGSAARLYWELVTNSLPEAYRFANRSKHPATDVFNAALNYLYGILYTIVETAIFATGLDPTLGIFHTDQYQKPTLAFDIIEPFRPWVDRFLVEFFWHNQIEANFFKITELEVTLEKKGKSVLIPLFVTFMEQHTTFRSQICSRKTHISRLAGELALELFNFTKK